MGKTYIISEIGINHNCDIDIAKDLILASKFAGADAVKFQKRTIDIVYTEEFLNSPRNSPWGVTQREQKEALEFGKTEYDEIDRFCKELHIDWFASAWDIPSLEFLDQYTCKYNKIASAMLTHLDFVREVAERGKKTFISTGMSNEEDINLVFDIFNEMNCPFVFLHTVSAYPVKSEALNFGYINWLDKNYTKFGYSGHEVGLSTTLAAVALGASVIERHITLDRSMYGSDQSASVEPVGFKRLVDGIREIEKAIGKGDCARDILEIEEPARKSLRYWEK